MELPHSVRSRFENVSRSQKTVGIVALHQDAIQRSLEITSRYRSVFEATSSCDQKGISSSVTSFAVGGVTRSATAGAPGAGDAGVGVTSIAGLSSGAGSGSPA